MDQSSQARFVGFQVRGLVALLVAVVAACSGGESNIGCGVNGTRTATSVGLVCAYPVVTGDFRCPASLPNRIDVPRRSVTDPDHALCVANGITFAQIPEVACVGFEARCRSQGQDGGTRDGSVSSDASDGGTAASCSSWSSGVALNQPTSSQYFGHSLATSADGTRLVVGDWAGQSDGAVTVFDLVNGSWSSGVRLSRPTVADEFGESVSISADGTRIAVADDDGDRGTVTIYDFSNGTWSGGTRIQRPANVSRFGYRVALSGSGAELAVGHYEAGAGSVVLYRFTNGTWSAGTVLSTPSTAREFGYSLSISSDGNWLAVGATDATAGPNGRDGAVYVYQIRNSLWELQTTLVANTDAGGNFGESVALSIDGTRLVVGGDQVEVFSRSGQTWSTGIGLMTSANAALEGLKVSVSGDGNRVAVGNSEAGNLAGLVVVYSLRNGTWSIEREVSRINSMIGFGASVALSDLGARLFVGTRHVRSSSQGGSVTVFDCL